MRVNKSLQKASPHFIVVFTAISRRWDLISKAIYISIKIIAIYDLFN